MSENGNDAAYSPGYQTIPGMDDINMHIGDINALAIEENIVPPLPGYYYGATTSSSSSSAAPRKGVRYASGWSTASTTTSNRTSAPADSRVERRLWFVVSTLLVSSPMILLLLLFVVRGKDTSSDSDNNIHTTPSSSATTTKAAVVNNADGDEHGGVMRARPCEIYPNNNNYHNMRLIQTSLGEPSAHWSRVSCSTPAPHSYSSSTSSSESYAAATSAIINVDFSTHAFSSKNENDNDNNAAQHRPPPPILGFGGAFTEAAAINYMSLSTDGRRAVMDLLFSTTLGLGYTLGRTHINSCDFSTASYSFDDADDDYELRDFDMDVTHDLRVGMIDMMLAATKIVERQQQQQQSRSSSSSDDGENNYGLRIIASPWSPPNWMKAPTATDIMGATHAANMTGSAGPVCIRDGVGEHSRYAKSWALYISKFIAAYANHGIDLFAITVQNEPEFAAPWEACSYDISSQGEFIATHLGPTLSDVHPTVKLLIFDHNKDHMVHWATELLHPTNPASTYISGTAYHWYAGGMDRLLDGALGTPNMHRFMSQLDILNVTTRSTQQQRQHIVLNSEACHCPTTGYAGGDLSIAWDRAARNAHTILADLAAGSNGFIEWNLLLDSIGGPNHLGNLCDAPLLAVPHRAAVSDDGTMNRTKEKIPNQLDFETAGHPFGRIVGDDKTREELHAEGSPAKYLDLGIVIQPMYYYVGHITRFVRPGSRAVPALVHSSSSSSSNNNAGSAAITTTTRTFRTLESDVPGGGINNLARTGIEVTLWPCEGSTRQEWLLNDGNQLQVFGHDWLGEPTTSCLGGFPDGDLGGLLLTSCDVTDGNPGKFEVVSIPDNKQKVHIVLQDKKKKKKKRDLKTSCLVVQPLRNNGGAYGPRGGAQVNIGNCDNIWAEWDHNPSMGEISSTVFGGNEVCLTTGWPFLQAGAFDTTSSSATNTGSNKATTTTKKVAVILNEAGESANYILKDEGKMIMTGSIPPHSIQTLTLDS